MDNPPLNFRATHLSVCKEIGKPGRRTHGRRTFILPFVFDHLGESSMFGRLFMSLGSSVVVLTILMTAMKPALAVEPVFDPIRVAAWAAPDYWMTVADPPETAVAPRSDVTAFQQILDAFLAAENTYDPGRLASMTTPDYFEVSPVGDVDMRDQFLGFYAPANRSAVPKIEIDAPMARMDGNVATVVARLSYFTTNSNGFSTRRAMRSTFVMRRGGDGWRIAFVQYTPISANKSKERGS